MNAGLGEDFYRNLLDSLFDAVYFVDRERRITYWNRAAERLTGYSAAEVVGRRCADNVLAHVDGAACRLCASDICPAAATMRDGRPREKRVFLVHKHGHRVPVRTRITPIFDEGGGIVGAVEVFSDDSAQVAAGQEMEQLRRAALIDTVTGIGNRRYGELRLEGFLSDAARFSWPFAVAFADIDDFKRVNDEHGHELGDAVLRAVARTLAGCVRASDVVVRWGGDEFLLLLRNVDRDALGDVLDKARALISQVAVPCASGFARVTISTGGSAARAFDTPETLVARVDNLMYESKRAGGNSVATDA